MKHLVIRSNNTISRYCEKNNIHIEKFNQPVKIAKNVTDCSGMFFGCESFNQPVEIPEGAKYCADMFLDASLLINR